MMLFKASFHKKPSATQDEVEDQVIHYLNALTLNGQVVHNYQYGWADDQFIVTLQMPKANSISPRYNSAYVQTALIAMLKVLLYKPQWEHLANDGTTYGTYKHAPFLYLFTSAFRSGPPIYCGHNGAPVPTYQLPIDFEQREYLYRWSVEYTDHDTMWLHSSTLEKPAYKELTKLDSSLTTRGRELCTQVEAGTGKPTYYYLMHYYRNNKREAVCPGCGSPWQIREKQDEQPFWQFRFKCDKCRLVSHFACE